MRRQVVPGPKGNLVLGSLRDFQRDPLAFLLNIADTYGGLARFHRGPDRVYLVNAPDVVYDVLVAQASKIRKSAFNTKLLAKFLGDGLLTSDGDFHRRQRRLIQPALHHQYLAGYGTRMVNYTVHMLDHWTSGESHDMDDAMMRLTMAIVTSALFGAEVLDTADKIGEAIAALQQITIREFKAGFILAEWIPVSRNRRRRAATGVVRDTVMQFIRARQASGENWTDLLSMLLGTQDARPS